MVTIVADVHDTLPSHAPVQGTVEPVLAPGADAAWCTRRRHGALVAERP